MSMTKQELDGVNESLAQAIHDVAVSFGKAAKDARRTCVNCMHFDEQREVCKLAGARPPARVIAFGCDSFEEDNIPF